MKNFSNKIWFISDTHFWHANIIKYCHRPYADIKTMNEDIIKRWNSVVGKDDIVWHLGDFAFFKRNGEQHEEVRKLVNSLHGKINLVLGNHDKRISKSQYYWINLGFQSVYDRPVLYMDNYILSHEPLITYNSLDIKYHPKLRNIFGHVHNSNADYYAMKAEDQKNWNLEHPEFRTIPDITSHTFNVSIEVIDYKPILFEDIVEKMKNA